MDSSFRKKIFLALLVCVSLHLFIRGASGAGYFYESDDEVRRISKFAGFVKRDGSILYLRIRSGAYVALPDTTDCVGWNSCRDYEFIDYFRDKGFYHVELYLGEPTEFLMISDKTGRRYMVQAPANVSPDRERFVAVSAGGPFDINGVFMWRFEGDRIVPELSYEPEEYEEQYDFYEFVEWKDNETVLLSRFARSDAELCPDSDSMTVPVVLKLKEDSWRFHEDLSRDAVQCGSDGRD